MSDIFVSYASEDLPRIQPLIRLFERRGWSVWWDRNILPGQVFSEVIEEELDAALCVVVIWSKNSTRSRWVRTEASAGESRKILVPVLIDDVKVPLDFRLIQSARLIGWDGEAGDAELDKIFRAVRRILGHGQAGGEGETSPDPAPEAGPSLEKYLRLLPRSDPIIDQYYWTPPVDVHALPDGYIVEVDLPGTAPDELEVEIESSSLTLSGVRRGQIYADQAKPLMMERKGSRFYRRLKFPDDLSGARVERRYVDGVLVLRLSK